MKLQAKKRYPPLSESEGRLGNIFRKYPKVEAVFLFGSAATNKTHDESDLDLAVYTNDPSAESNKLEILEELAVEGFCDVDLVFLKEGNIVLQYEAVRHRRVIYKRDSFQLGKVFSKILRQYFDFYPYLKVQRKAYKERIMNDTG
ncbi:nucleotidyltransferase domain-containing protein [Thermodesulfobacteriota bacterium]